MANKQNQKQVVIRCQDASPKVVFKVPGLVLTVPAAGKVPWIVPVNGKFLKFVKQLGKYCEVTAVGILLSDLPRSTSLNGSRLDHSAFTPGSVIWTSKAGHAGMLSPAEFLPRCRPHRGDVIQFTKCPSVQCYTRSLDTWHSAKIKGIYGLDASLMIKYDGENTWTKKIAPELIEENLSKAL